MAKKTYNPFSGSRFHGRDYSKYGRIKARQSKDKIREQAILDDIDENMPLDEKYDMKTIDDKFGC